MPAPDRRGPRVVRGQADTKEMVAILVAVAALADRPRGGPAGTARRAEWDRGRIGRHRIARSWQTYG